MSRAPGASPGANAKRCRSPSPPGVALGPAAAVAVVAMCLGAQPASIVERMLTQRMGFSAADMRALERGSAVVHSLDTPVREEVAHVGVVYLDAPAEQFIERFRDIERFEHGPGIPQIGRFDSPPRIEDLGSLWLPAADVRDLPACRPGDCEVKLPAEAFDRFRDGVDWTSPGAAEQASKVAREMILELVRAYRADGNAALGSYARRDEPSPVATAFRALLASRDPLPVPVPMLLAYLDDYPHGRPPGAEDFFYWTVVDFGLKPTIRVNHVTIYPLPARPSTGVAYAIAIKQLYASHYFHTTLELRFLVDRVAESGRAGAALISITRSRNDGMTGFRGWFLRPIIRRRSRDGVRDYMEHVRRQVERAVPTAP